MNWMEAQTYCADTFDSDLASIITETDNNEITTLCNNATCWIGLIKNTTNSLWFWIDGKSVDYENWAINQPNVEDECAIIKFNQTVWSGTSCENYNPNFICNYQETKHDSIIYLRLLGIVISLNMNETTTYFAIIILVLALTSFCINLCAIAHKKHDKTYDDVKYTSLFVYFLQVFDFYSDINFAIFLLVHNMQILFICSSVFVAIPWLYNVLFLFWLHRIKWMGNVKASSWMRSHGHYLLSLTMMSGGVYYSLRLLNSRLFGLKILDMGLSHRQTLYIAQRTVIVTSFLEQVPQILVQLTYILFSGSTFDIAVSMALISSATSLVLAVVASIMNMLDDLHGM